MSVCFGIFLLLTLFCVFPLEGGINACYHVENSESMLDLRTRYLKSARWIVCFIINLVFLNRYKAWANKSWAFALLVGWEEKTNQRELCLYSWCSKGVRGINSERSPWVQLTMSGEVQQEECSTKAEQLLPSCPPCSGHTLRRRLAYLCSSCVQGYGIQVVLEKSLHPFPFISKIKMHTLEGSVLYRQW